MNDVLYASRYMRTSEADMLALDDERRMAESDPQNADWNYFADRYEAQGRPAMAKKCRGRAEYYGWQPMKPKQKIKLTACVICGDPIGRYHTVICGSDWCKSEYRRLYVNSYNAARGIKTRKDTELLPYPVGDARMSR